MTSARDKAEDFVRAYQRGVWRFLRALGCATDEADDLTQEVFLVALRSPPRHEAAARALLRQTARHLWLRRQRDDQGRARRLVEAADSLWQQDCDVDDGDGWLTDLEACLQRLEARSRRAVDLFYGERLSRVELGVALGISDHGARTLLQRVRKFLRECIEQRRRP